MRRSIRWLLFLCWALAGGGLVLGLLTVFTIGAALLLVSVVACGVLLWRRQSRNPTAIGLLVGAGFVLLSVAWLNRAGPGTTCTATALSESCVDEWSPWPWMIAGLTVVTIGVGAFAVVDRRKSPAPVRPAVDLRH